MGVIKNLAAPGAEDIILSCTESYLLISEADGWMPPFASRAIHSEAALRCAVSERPRLATRPWDRRHAQTAARGT